jgi:pyruvate/2-oxoglutarate dehydrogenase complex dihydrolipoamide dehydrogenase (E3) component
MPDAERVDAIVIGAGQAGVPLATYLAKGGLQTALIEREHVGGTCINTGCTPTKTMVASARIAYLAGRAAEFGVHTGPVTVDIARIRQRKRDIVTSWRGGSERRLRQTEGLDLIYGEARFTGARSVEVTTPEGKTRTLSAEKIFINAGARPVIPAIEGIDQAPVLDSTSIMELDAVPDHLLVLGGGYIGLEFGQMFRRFGSQVTIVQRQPQLLTMEDADVSEEIAKILREDGIEILLESDAARISRGPGGEIRLMARTPEGERTLAGSHLLVAAGRAPNTERLNLGSAGVETDRRGYIRVDERLETTAPGIYALGDINGGPAFTHISYDDFRIIRTNLFTEGRRGHSRTTDRSVPYTVFMDPQLGRVGLSEREARARGLKIRVAKLPMSHVARAIEIGETRGFIKAVVDAETDQILGCAVLGIEGGEIMGILQVAMIGRIPYTTIRDDIFSHPTLSEALNNLFLAWEPEPMDVMLSQAAYSATMMSSETTTR